MHSDVQHHNNAAGNGKRRVLLVDDHPIFRRGMSHLLNQEEDLMTCAEAEAVPDAIGAVEKTKPDIVLVDISLKGANGIELIKAIRAQQPKLPSLVLSVHDESIYAERALRAGARGYIMKQESPEHVLAGIRKVLGGGLFVSPTIGTHMIRKFVDGKESFGVSAVHGLSDRELEVLQLIGRGLGTRQIAGNLHLSVKTIESHRAHIKEKLGLKNAPEMMRFAVEWVTQQPL